MQTLVYSFEALGRPNAATVKSDTGKIKCVVIKSGPIPVNRLWGKMRANNNPMTQTRFVDALGALKEQGTIILRDDLTVEAAK